MTPPAFNHDTRFFKRIENLAVEQFIAQARIEALDKAVLPWAARRDVGGFCADGRDPVLNRLGDELGPIVGTNIRGHAAQNEQIGQHVDYRGRVELAIDPNGQAFVRELVDDVQHAIFSPVMGAILHEVV